MKLNYILRPGRLLFKTFQDQPLAPVPLSLSLVATFFPILIVRSDIRSLRIQHRDHGTCWCWNSHVRKDVCTFLPDTGVGQNCPAL